MRDDAFKKIDSWKGKRPFCFSIRVSQTSTLSGILRLSFYKLHKLQKLQEIEKGCGKPINKKIEDNLFKQINYLTFSFNVVLCVYDRIIRKIRNLSIRKSSRPKTIS